MPGRNLRHFTIVTALGVAFGFASGRARAVDCNTNGTQDNLELSGHDCNTNLTLDVCELTGHNCNTNGTLDVCELSGHDCNSNLTLDVCELSGRDCNTNLTLDACELTGHNCNTNGTLDVCELVGHDCNTNLTLDACELSGHNCNTNGTLDVCELNGHDCNTNLTIDACELSGRDCNTDTTIDVCEVNQQSNVSGNPNIPIQDTATETTNLSVGGIGNVSDVDVRINLTHTWDSDLILAVSHAAVTVTVSNRNGSSGDNYTNTVFDDSAVTPIGFGAAPFAATYRPDQPLSGFNGMPMSGTWTLSVTDAAAQDTGTLLGWGLAVSTGLADCNTNGTPDVCEFGGGRDCNTNGTLDVCERSGNDCNSNGSLDVCEPLGDCNFNGTPDVCEALSDCDFNGTPDICQFNYSDCNSNGIPDFCEPFADCNTDGIFDACDIYYGYTYDINDNGVPDICEGGFADCNTNGIPDIYEIYYFTDCNFNNTLDVCEPGYTDCNTDGLADFCEGYSDCNFNGTNDLCDIASGHSTDLDHNGVPDECQAFADCNSNGTPDYQELFGHDCNDNGTLDICEFNYSDCNSNGIPDFCEFLTDCNFNGTPDICETNYSDCNTNGLPDSCEGFVDCNTNGTFDACDITHFGHADANQDGTPDECQQINTDCNTNGTPDYLELSGRDCNNNGTLDVCDFGYSDCNSDGIADFCEFLPDCNFNGTPDVCEASYSDCNTNGLPDSCEGFADCNTNGTFDACDITRFGQADANHDGTPDECQQSATDCNTDGTSDYLELGGHDCNANGTLDVCESGYRDCNSNGTADFCEFLSDCNFNGTPDVCEHLPDCNSNGTPDACEGPSDCNTNGTADFCELTGRDCNSNGILDVCEPGYSDCDGDGVPDSCELGIVDCNTDGTRDACQSLPDCDTNGIPDMCEENIDCNSNGTPDICEIASGTLSDCNSNHVADLCEAADCNTDGTLDPCDVTSLHSQDADTNEVPDECETDCNTDGTPDIIEVTQGRPGCADCNSNNTPDICELAALGGGGGVQPLGGGAPPDDCNTNDTPDECEWVDCNTDGTLDVCDIGDGLSEDCNANGVPDECEPDCNTNGTPDDCDILTGELHDEHPQDGQPDECELPVVVMGDMNFDGNVDGEDIPYFVTCLLNGTGACFPADMNTDGRVDQNDVAMFIHTLLTHVRQVVNNICLVDLAIDSNNNGRLDDDIAADDAIEDQAPGKLICNCNSNCTLTPILLFKLCGETNRSWMLNYPNNQVLVWANSNGTDIVVSGAANPFPMPHKLWVQGIATSQTQGDVDIVLTIVPTNMPDQPIVSDRVKATVVSIRIDYVRGERKNATGEFNAEFDPHQPGRLFIDTDEDFAINGAPDRQRAYCTAFVFPFVGNGTTPSPNLKCRWEAYDPDDPATDAILDPNGAAGGDNTGQAHEATGAGGHWWTAFSANNDIYGMTNQASTNKVPNATTPLGSGRSGFTGGGLGGTVFMVTAGMFSYGDDAGDNYKIRANIMMNDRDVGCYDESAVLTVWRQRTLWVYAMTKQNDDVQVIPNGMGNAAMPNQICIRPGPNGVSDTLTPGGDDQRVGQSINTGANGMCETVANNGGAFYDTLATAAVFRQTYADGGDANHRPYLDWIVQTRQTNRPFVGDRSRLQAANYIHTSTDAGTNHADFTFSILGGYTLVGNTIFGNATHTNHCSVGVFLHYQTAALRLRLPNTMYNTDVHELGHILIGKIEGAGAFHGTHNGSRCAYNSADDDLITICPRHVNKLRDYVARSFQAIDPHTANGADTGNDGDYPAIVLDSNTSR